MPKQVELFLQRQPRVLIAKQKVSAFACVSFGKECSFWSWLFHTVSSQDLKPTTLTTSTTSRKGKVKIKSRCSKEHAKSEDLSKEHVIKVKWTVEEYLKTESSSTATWIDERVTNISISCVCPCKAFHCVFSVGRTTAQDWSVSGRKVDRSRRVTES